MSSGGDSAFARSPSGQMMETTRDRRDASLTLINGILVAPPLPCHACPVEGSPRASTQTYPLANCARGPADLGRLAGASRRSGAPVSCCSAGRGRRRLLRRSVLVRPLVWVLRISISVWTAAVPVSVLRVRPRRFDSARSPTERGRGLRRWLLRG